jgi:protein-S-isoprenylcysteine O-methyltransferase Ste14
LPSSLITALILLNARHWFRDPLAPRQIVSWLLLTACIWPVIEGFRLLRKVGRPSRETVSGEKLAFENTTELVTVGLYRFIRHPMYPSLLGLGWGACLKDPSATAVGLALAASAALLATALAEERENLAHFGPAYGQYMKTSRRFIPFVF